MYFSSVSLFTCSLNLRSWWENWKNTNPTISTCFCTQEEYCWGRFCSHLVNTGSHHMEMCMYIYASPDVYMHVLLLICLFGWFFFIWICTAELRCISCCHFQFTALLNGGYCLSITKCWVRLVKIYTIKILALRSSKIKSVDFFTVSFLILVKPVLSVCY